MKLNTIIQEADDIDMATAVQKAEELVAYLNGRKPQSFKTPRHMRIANEYWRQAMKCLSGLGSDSDWDDVLRGHEQYIIQKTDASTRDEGPTQSSNETSKDITVTIPYDVIEKARNIIRHRRGVAKHEYKAARTILEIVDSLENVERVIAAVRVGARRNANK